MGDDKKE